MTSNPFYLQADTSRLALGEVTVDVVAVAGDNAGSVQFNITYDTTQGSYDSVTFPAGWLGAGNPTISGTTGTVTAGAIGTAGVAAGSSDAIIASVTFTLAVPSPPDFVASVTITDWEDEAGNDHGTSIDLGPLSTPICFAGGTLIASLDGDRPVESLQPGDMVSTMAGGDPQAVVWIGRRHVDCRRHPRPDLVWPVRVAAGAFGPNRPRRDLLLSPNHAVFVNNNLIPIKYLINDITIEQAQIEDVTYYHVELPRHEIILAEGLPVESYLDTGDRSNFFDGSSVVRLFPDFAGLPNDVAKIWETRGAAPLVVTGPKLEAARAAVALNTKRQGPGIEKAAS